MVEQPNPWGENERKESKNISESRVEAKGPNLLIEFLVTKDNGDKIRLTFTFDLSKAGKQKPKIEKSIKESSSRAFINKPSMKEVLYIEPKYFNQILKIAYAIFKEKYEEYQKEQKRKLMQPRLPLE